MKNLKWILLALLLSGCVSIVEQSSAPVLTNQKELTKIGQVKLGMNYSEVSAILGKTLVIGYEIKDELSKSLEPIAMANPVRIEKISQSQKIYFVVYYYTKVVKADQLMSDDELTPLIFESMPSSLEIAATDRLVGIGIDFLYRIKK